MRLRAQALPLLVILGIGGIGANSVHSLPAQTPGATRIIDVVATDTGGVPVTNLQAQDVMLRIGGRVHPILDLRLVNQNPGPILIPPPYASNQGASGRTVAIATDVTRLESTDATPVRDSINAVVETLAPRDRISLIAMATDGLATDYTTRRDIVRAAVDRVSPAASTGQTQETAALASLALLERLSTTLAAEPGHKTLVLIAPPFAASGDTRRAMQSVATVIATQRIQLVVIDPRGEGAAGSGLAELAAATGATLLARSESLSSRFAAVAGRTAARYQLRFMFTDEEQDDKLHRVQVSILRKDVQLAAPPQLFIPRKGSGVDGLSPLADMLRQPRMWSELPLRLAVFPVLDVERDRLRLLVLGETEDPAVALAWAEFALIAPSGAIAATWKAENADLATRPMMTAVLAAPGAYRLRMVASELTGRRGSVDYEFDARLTPAGPLALGPLMFGGINNQAFLPYLQFQADAAAVMGYAEIYGVPAATDTLASTFEVAATADGPPVQTVAGSVRTTPNVDRRAAVATLDLAPLAPGDYTVRAIVTLNGKEIGRVNRTLRKAAR